VRRKVVWVGVVVVGVLLVPVLGFGVYVAIDGIPRYPVQHVVLRAEPTPERLARGKKLASMLCAGCHMDYQLGALTGKQMVDAPAQFGVIYSRNITQHPVKGIGAWSDGEIAYLLRTGIARDGRYLPPYMPKLAHMSDEDLLSIIAWLRSDDAWVAARDVENRPTRPSLLTKALAHGPFKPLPYPKAPIPPPDRNDPVAHGRYLVASLDCYGCHSADFTKMNVLEPEKSLGYMGGGNRLNDSNGRAIYSANLTFDEQFGIGRLSKAQFRRAVRDGFRPDGTPLQYPMTHYGELDDQEADAIYAYLGTLPKIHKPRKATEQPPPYAGGSEMSEGKRIYQKYACQACHGDTGDGVCNLRQAAKKYPTDAALRAFIERPQAQVPGSRMPRWEGVIQEAEYPLLLDYLRTLQQ
jgi:mono/diheme cytochrome c family protein